MHLSFFYLELQKPFLGHFLFNSLMLEANNAWRLSYFRNSCFSKIVHTLLGLPSSSSMANCSLWAWVNCTALTRALTQDVSLQAHDLKIWYNSKRFTWHRFCVNAPAKKLRHGHLCARVLHCSVNANIVFLDLYCSLTF